MQWGRWYKSLYDLPPGDRPDDLLLDDDVELDRWFDAFTRRIAREAGRKSRVGNTAIPEYRG